MHETRRPEETQIQAKAVVVMSMAMAEACPLDDCNPHESILDTFKLSDGAPVWREIALSNAIS